MPNINAPNMSETTVRPFRAHDIHLYWEHLRRHGMESGRDGDYIFMPFEEPWGQSIDELMRARNEKLNRSILESGWERCWVLTDEENIYGDFRLQHEPAVKTCLHRATLSMGIERSHRGMGHGSEMLKVGIDWARRQESLSWIQLYVFATNEPAIKLYQKYGFKETGRNVDMFRVFGQKIDDVTMTLKL